MAGLTWAFAFMIAAETRHPSVELGAFLAVFFVSLSAGVDTSAMDEHDVVLRERGGEPILYSAATADALMEWFTENREALEKRAAADEDRDPL